jgi:hypothetical protein
MAEDETQENRESEEKDERELRNLVLQVTDTNKRLDDDYDERLRKLDLKKKLAPTDESAEEEHLSRIQVAKEKYAELKSRISNARREGKDPFIADLMSRNIGPKIKMAEVTREKKDFDEIEDLIKKADQELVEALKEEKVDIKKEIEERLKQEKERESGKTTAGE